MKKLALVCMFGLAMLAGVLQDVTESVAKAESKSLLVVATFDAKGVGADDVEFVMDVFTSNFANMGFASIVDRSSFDKMPEFCNTLIGKVGGESSFSANTSRHQSSASYTNYKIGDEGPGGGIVFYVSKEGFRVYDGKGGNVIFHYLEMSKNTLGVSQWFPEYSKIGATQEGLGYGKFNTYKILNAKTSKGLTEINCAAYRCSKYSTSGTKAGEWWLPSKDELNLIYQNQKDAVLASCTTKWHWSSSESGDDLAWSKIFGNGGWYLNLKDYTKYSVRAVRAF